MLRGAVYVGDGHNMLWASCQADELRQDAIAGDIKRQIDSGRRQSPDTPHHACAVCDGFGAHRMQQGVFGWAGAAYHTRSARYGELHGGGADIPGRSVDQQRVACGDTELIQRAGGGFYRGRQGGRLSELKRGGDGGVVGEHRQFGLSRAIQAEAEHAIA